jgi:hypothetical protein
MGRGGRRRARVQAEVHAALAEFAAAVEIRLHDELDRSRRTQVALVEAVHGLRTDLTRRDKEFARALTAFGEAVDHAAERIEAERVERAALVDAVTGLTQSLTTTRAASLVAAAADTERLLGGRVIGRAPDRPTTDVEIVLDEIEPKANGNGNGNGHTTGNGNGNGDRIVNGDEVQCYLDGRWVDGFEVLDVVQDGDIVRYRLRRVSDGSVSRRLFDAGEVRKATADAPTAAQPAQATRPEIYWTRS